MIEKIKNIFKEKDEKKKTENLVAFLIILVVTLILMNKILSSDSKESADYKNETGVSLVSSKQETLNSVDEEDSSLEKSLENILSKIDGIGKVQVLITYQKENPDKIEGAIVIAEGVRKPWK